MEPEKTARVEQRISLITLGVTDLDRARVLRVWEIAFNPGWVLDNDGGVHI